MISLQQVIDAVEQADECATMFYDTETGQTVVQFDEMISGIAQPEIDELLENSTDRFLRFPDQYDIHPYAIMADFTHTLPDGAAKKELVGAIHGKGAFRRFQNGIRYHGIEQSWYDFQAEAYREIAIKWCHDNRLEYV